MSTTINKPPLNCPECGAENKFPQLYGGPNWEKYKCGTVVKRNGEREIKCERPWIPWSGGRCPVPKDVRVDYKLRSGTTSTFVSGELAWWHGGNSSDIIAYRLAKEQPKAVDPSPTIGGIPIITFEDDHPKPQQQTQTNTMNEQAQTATCRHPYPDYGSKWIVRDFIGRVVGVGPNGVVLRNRWGKRTGFDMDKWQNEAMPINSAPKLFNPILVRRRLPSLKLVAVIYTLGILSAPHVPQAVAKVTQCAQWLIGSLWS